MCVFAHITHGKLEENDMVKIQKSDPFDKQMADAQRIANETGKIIYLQDGEDGIRFAVFPEKLSY